VDSGISRNPETNTPNRTANVRLRGWRAWCAGLKVPRISPGPRLAFCLVGQSTRHHPDKSGDRAVAGCTLKETAEPLCLRQQASDSATDV
jgi:hypothetical protein